MRRIYYFSVYKYFFGYLRNYLSVTIQLLRYKSLVDQWTMLLRFSHPGHRSPFNIFIFTSYCASGRDNSTRRTPPGRDFDLRNCGVLLKFIFACRLTNFLSLQTYINELSGDGGIWTRDLRLAKALLSHWATSPELAWVSGLDRIRTCDPSLIRTVL